MLKTTLLPLTLVAAMAAPAFAGDVSDAGTDDMDVIVLPAEAAGSSAGSLGSLGGGIVGPALAGLLIVGAIAAGSGS